MEFIYSFNNIIGNFNWGNFDRTMMKFFDKIGAILIGAIFILANLTRAILSGPFRPGLG